MTAEEIAHVCHDANRAYSRTLGDESHPPWEDAPEWQRASAISGVQGLIDGTTSPAGLHERWAAEKRADGWTYGEVKDPEARTHPCLVPYDDLPPEQRRKDALFLAVVEALGW